MTKPQHQLALDLANEVRRERRELRGWVSEPHDAAESRERLAVLLENAVPPGIAKMPVHEIMRWPWKMSASRRADCLVAAECSPLREVGRLSERQRHQLAEVLRCSTDELGAARRERAGERWARGAAA